MKNKVLIILYSILCFSINSFSYEEKKENTAHENQNNNQQIEDTMIFLRNGTSLLKIDGKNEKNIINSIGMYRYSDMYIYGIETNSFYLSKTLTNFSDLTVISGYRHLWNKRFLPFVLFGFGTANKTIDNLNTKSGMNYSLELGLDVFKIYNFKNSISIRKKIIQIEDNEEIQSNDLIWTIGYYW